MSRTSRFLALVIMTIGAALISYQLGRAVPCNKGCTEYTAFIALDTQNNKIHYAYSDVTCTEILKIQSTWSNISVNKACQKTDPVVTIQSLDCVNTEKCDAPFPYPEFATKGAKCGNLGNVPQYKCTGPAS
jgi:hypothetical protein